MVINTKYHLGLSLANDFISLFYLDEDYIITIYIEWKGVISILKRNGYVY
jgi:hypothetical protein